MLYAFLAVLIWLLDRASKLLVTRYLPLGANRPLLGSLLALQHVQNTGAAFGVLQNQVVGLAVVSVLLLGGFYLLRKQLALLGRFGQIGGAMVVAGALGNLYDRIFLRHVVDFIAVGDFPVFNLADSSVVIGAGLLFVGIWDLDRRERQVADTSTERR